METRIACGTCGLVQCVGELTPGMATECCRCGSILVERKIDSLVRKTAFSHAALIFYVPANINPILQTEHYGAYSESAVWDGCVALFRNGQRVVAVIVFLASILPKLIWKGSGDDT